MTIFFTQKITIFHTHKKMTIFYLEEKKSCKEAGTFVG